MHELIEIWKTIGSMPVESLLAAVMLGAFALAGFAIYAVLTLAKERH